MRKANIFINSKLAGSLEETVSGYIFRYDPAYAGSYNSLPVSLTMPLTQLEHTSKSLHHVFNGLIPEGLLLDIAQTKLNLETKDRMGLLLALCRDNIGAIEVHHEETNDKISVTGQLHSIPPEDINRDNIPKHGFCLCCLKPLNAIGENFNYHPECSLQLFGSKTPPVLDLSETTFESIVGEQLGMKMSLTGVQIKFSGNIVSLAKRQTHIFPNQYIIKPDPINENYKQLAIFEQLCMHLSRSLRLRTAESGLLYLPNGYPVFITKRFDRAKSGKISVEDFTQIFFKTEGHDKYMGSIEQIVQGIRKYCGRFALPNIQELYKVTVLNYLIGNADNHFRNFSLVYQKPGDELLVSLAPFYDLVPSKFYVARDKEETALSISGKKKTIGRAGFVQLAEYCRLPVKELDETLGRFDTLLAKIPIWLDDLGIRQKDDFSHLINERLKLLRRE